LPADFDYVWFACWLVVLGVGQGMFAAPNTAAIMNNLPAEHRGAGSGMRSTFQNAAMMPSIGLFFSIVIAALAVRLPPILASGLEQAEMPAAPAEEVARVPPAAALFAAFLGCNPMENVVPEPVLHGLPDEVRARIRARSIFPHLICRALPGRLVMGLLRLGRDARRGGRRLLLPQPALLKAAPPPYLVLSYSFSLGTT
jgi:MFS family permease